MNLQWLAIFLVLFVFLNSVVAAESSSAMQAFNKGLAADKNDDLEQAFNWYKQAAELGMAEAKFNVATMYEQGSGVDRNMESAIYWYQQAASDDYLEAKFNLGLLHEKTGNDKKAFNWYLSAANGGHVKAQNNVGVMYNFGRGTTQNYQRAVHWYQKAAERGNTLAQYNLGMKYLLGQGVTKDKMQAYIWLDVAASNKDVAAMVKLYEVTKSFSGSEFEQAKQLAQAKKLLLKAKMSSGEVRTGEASIEKL